MRPVGSSAASADASTAQVSQAEDTATRNEAGPISLGNPATNSDTKQRGIVKQANSEETQVGVAGPLDPVAREKAIAEMRAKAANASGEKTKIGALPEASDDPMNAQKQKKLTTQLERTQKRSEGSLTDAELEAKKRSIEAMRLKAKIHYDSAMKAIEN